MSHRKDHALQQTVEDELDWAQDVDSTRVGVEVDKGVVTLSGDVESFAQRRAALHAALRVRGTVAVVDDMRVHPRNGWVVTETDLAKEVERALRRDVEIPTTVKAAVTGHDVLLTGEVDWQFQREASLRAVQYLRGVGSVTNDITLSARPAADEAAARIKAAFVRSARLDADAIHVTANGTTVTLTGEVPSWAARVEASKAAWASPHVAKVENRLMIRG